MNDTDITVTVPYTPGLPTFRIPIRLGQSGRIVSLSGDALRLILFISYKLYRRKIREVTFLESEVSENTGIKKESISRARIELKNAGLIHFEMGYSRATYRLCKD
jgi:hypothetical protein